MNSMKKTAIFFFLICSSIQCGSNFEPPKIIYTDLDNCKTQVSIKLSDLIDSCRLIQLETTTESLIGSRISLLYIAEDHILVADQNGVYKFSENGKFLKKLLKTGRGPNEISSYASFHYYEKKNLLFIDNRLSSKGDILLYNVRLERFQTPIKKCFPVNLSNFIVYEDSLLMGSPEVAGFLTHDSDVNPYALFIQNFKGQFLFGIKSTKKLVHEDYNSLYQRMSIHQGDGFVHLKNSHEDTIFSFAKNRLSPYIIPSFKSNLKIPRLMPEVGTRHLSWELFENKSFMIIDLNEFGGWENQNGFAGALYYHDFYFINKTNGKYAKIKSFSDDLLGKTTALDRSINKIPGNPKSLPNGKLYTLYYPQDLVNAENNQNDIFPSMLISQLNQLKNKVDLMDNPILLIGVPKNKPMILK